MSVMGQLDDWALAAGSSACRFLSRNDHDTVYRGLCSDGSSAAGWKLAVFVVMFIAVTFVMWRVMRPR